MTDQGLNHPALQLSSIEGNNASEWDEIPVLTDGNVGRDTKSGATVLARLDTSSRREPDQPGIPLVVFQRYGRGHTLAFLTGSSWRWQMLEDQEDQKHETFWRQMLRWLVRSAKNPITVETKREVYSQNEVVDLRAEVSDKAFNRINDARVEATITSPSGEIFTLPLQWDAQEDGIYRGQLTPHEDGFYAVEIKATASALAESDKERQAKTSFLTSTTTATYMGRYWYGDWCRNISCASIKT